MSLTVPTPTTALEAVNIMLGAIGESPVSNLSSDNIDDVAVAKSILEEEMKAVQGEGWHFNSESKFPLALNSDNEVTVPTNCLSVDANTLLNPTMDVTLRGNRLYDKINHTFKFTQTIHVDMIIALPLEEMPEAGRRYVMVKAARVFQDRLVGSDVLHKFGSIDEARARSTLVSTETDNADRTIFSSTDEIALLIRR